MDKKISFGFSKIKKPTTLLSTINNNVGKKDNKEYIECLEEKTIKIIGKETKEIQPLIIPLLNNTKTSSALASLKILRETLGEQQQQQNEQSSTSKSKENQESSKETQLIVSKLEANSIENLTIEARAAREILNEVEQNLSIDDDAKTTDDKKIILQLPTSTLKPLNADELPLDGADESTIDDYEKIPIGQFGLAVLRGMGWKEDVNSKKNKSIIDEPMVRPKGMGLGADKMLKTKPLLIAPKIDEKLEIKKHAFCRIIGGKHINMYGQIEGLDDHAGRVIIKFAIGGAYESLNEFLVQPVTKEEYTKYGKVLNSKKFEEYKRKQEQHHEQDINNDKLMETNNDDRNSKSSDQQSQYNYSKDIKMYANSSDSDKGHKKYSHKKSKKHRKSKRSRSRSRDDREQQQRQQQCSSSDEDEVYRSRYVKKKTKKSKRQRSRSRTRR